MLTAYGISFIHSSVSKALPLSFGYTKLSVLVVILGYKQQKPTQHTGKEYSGRNRWEGGNLGMGNGQEIRQWWRASKQEETTIFSRTTAQVPHHRRPLWPWAKPNHLTFFVLLVQDSVFQVGEVIGQTRSRVHALISGEKERVFLLRFHRGGKLYKGSTRGSSKIGKNVAAKSNYTLQYIRHWLCP